MAERLDGACWAQLTPAEKRAAVLGLRAGGAARGLADSLADRQPAYAFATDYARLPERTALAALVRHIDAFYGAAGNGKVAWPWAYLVAALTARDDDSNDRAGLVRFLRAHGRLPISGILLGSASADSVMIESQGKRHEVRLAGVTARGIDPAIQARARRLVDALTRTGYLDCKAPTPTEVVLIYKDDLFAEDGRLNAYVALRNGLVVCIGERAVSFSELDRATYKFSGELNVNNILLSKGLALFEAPTDAKWPEHKQAIRSILARAVESAGEARLYIHGGQGDDIVELVAGGS